ncbi:MAG: hypothetical protein L7R87_04140 [Flavobacteriaceae bacterium]|nr:hypothetical protein [Flavobacteriaceae bacterium]
MGYYKDDRSFTNYVHNNLAIPKIYETLGWNILEIDKDRLEYIDINLGIDYVLKNQNGTIKNIQERFRDSFYQKYNDATLRYRRDKNSDPSRMKSEFFKIKADYLVYGITNGKKFIDKRHTLTDFIKWVILDLNYLKEKYENKELEIVTTKKITCEIFNQKLICPENFNPDGSSSFIPFDILMLNKLWGDKVIIAQNRYF